MPAAVSGGISAVEALGVADEAIGIEGRPTQSYRARAAQFFDDRLRTVFVVVVAGGTMPFDGPVSGPLTGRMRVAPVTGVIIDAETGEFLRGLMHNAEPVGDTGE